MQDFNTGPRLYNLFPRLFGPISAWREQLDRIAGMGFDWVFVNPIHYPGFSGSLYAVKDYYRLNPAFVGDDDRPHETIIGDFVAAADRVGLKVMLDLVINHTAKDCTLTESRPDWYVRDARGRIRSPRAIDPDDARKVTVWGDLAELDWHDRPAREAMLGHFTEIACHYTRLGVAGFRCDAAYQVPGAVWGQLIPAVRAQRSDALFAAETLGCRPEQIEQLRPAGFDFLFNSSKWWDFRQPWLLEQYEAMRSIAPSISFPETHDTERLMSELPLGVDASGFARQRYMFAAVFSTGVMIPAGFEFGYRTKPDVVKTTPEWQETPRFDLGAFIAAVNAMRAAWPVFNEEGPQDRVDMDEPPVFGLVRRTRDGGHWSLTLINPDWSSAPVVFLKPFAPDIELADGIEVTPGRLSASIESGCPVSLAPGDIRVFVKRL